MHLCIMCNCHARGCMNNLTCRSLCWTVRPRGLEKRFFYAWRQTELDGFIGFTKSVDCCFSFNCSAQLILFPLQLTLAASLTHCCFSSSAVCYRSVENQFPLEPENFFLLKWTNPNKAEELSSSSSVWTFSSGWSSACKAPRHLRGRSWMSLRR